MPDRNPVRPSSTIIFGDRHSETIRFVRRDDPPRAGRNHHQVAEAYTKKNGVVQSCSRQRQQDPDEIEPGPNRMPRPRAWESENGLLANHHALYYPRAVEAGPRRISVWHITRTGVRVEIRIADPVSAGSGSRRQPAAVHRDSGCPLTDDSSGHVKSARSVFQIS